MPGVLLGVRRVVTARPHRGPGTLPGPGLRADSHARKDHLRSSLAAVLVVYSCWSAAAGCAHPDGTPSRSPSAWRCRCCRSSALVPPGRIASSSAAPAAGAPSWTPRAACPSTSCDATPVGRIDRDSADAFFARRKAETEDAPGRLARLVPARRRLPRRPGHPARPQGDAARHRPARDQAGPRLSAAAGPRRWTGAATRRAGLAGRYSSPRPLSCPRPGRTPRAPQEVRVAVGEQGRLASPTQTYEDQGLPLHRARESEPLHRLLHRTDRRRPGSQARSSL